MLKTLTMPKVPQVLDEDEMPFVVGVGVDRRRALTRDGVHYRRGRDRCTIELDAGQVRLRAVLLVEDGCYLMANLGPLLNEWWPLLQQSGPSTDRPFLSAGAQGRPVLMGSDGVELPVHVVPPSEAVPSTTTVLGLSRTLDDSTLETRPRTPPQR